MYSDHKIHDDVGKIFAQDISKIILCKVDLDRTTIRDYNRLSGLKND